MNAATERAIASRSVREMEPARSAITRVLSALVATGLTRGRIEIVSHETLPGHRAYGDEEGHGWLTRLELSPGDDRDGVPMARLDLAHGTELISIFIRGDEETERAHASSGRDGAHAMRHFGRWSPTSIEGGDNGADQAEASI
jgi:hypothetical protein